MIFATFRIKTDTFGRHLSKLQGFVSKFGLMYQGL